jgi:hypothetical protein
MQAYSPTGVLITGTYEMCPCRANIQLGSFQRAKDGTLIFEWEGSSDMFWDGQTAETRDGKVIYLDENGDEWLEDQIVLREEDSDPTEEVK